MYGPEIYEGGKKPPQAFVRSLKNFDPMLVCKWNKVRSIFEILRPKDPATLADLRAHGINDPYDVVLECAETSDCRVLGADGSECRMRLPKDPGPWCFEALRAKDTWTMPGGVDGANAAFIANSALLEAQERAARNAFHIHHREEGHAAICRDLNISRARVPIGMSGTRR